MDLSPGILASSRPVSANGRSAKFYPEDRNLVLRSSAYNMTGCRGYEIYGLPIFAKDLLSLLTDTQADLQEHGGNDYIDFYQFNTTKWSFSVIVPNTTLHYSSIQATVTRFLKLRPSKKPSEITTTRVGVLLNGTNPVADVRITPRPAAVNTTYVPFATFHKVNDQNLSSTEPTEVFKITPYGSTCFYESINETVALSPFLRSPPSTIQTPPLRPRTLESQMLARVGQTAFDMSIRIFRGAFDGHPVRVELWMIDAIVSIAVMQLTFAALLWGIFLIGIEDPDLDREVGDLYGPELDTGFFVLGKIAARLVVRITRKDVDGRFVWLKEETWREAIKRLIVPLKEGAAGEPMGLHRDGWAMEGEMLGPEDGDKDVNEGGRVGDGRNSSRVVIGRWQLWFGEPDTDL